jgi:PAS domain S-box-containing protein
MQHTSSQKKRTIVGRLKANTRTNIAFFCILAGVLVYAMYTVGRQNQRLAGYYNERTQLLQLDALVSGETATLHEILILRNDSLISPLLLRSQDFQKTFTSYRDAVYERGGFAELSLVGEYEPVVVAIRSTIVRAIVLYRQGNIDSAQDHYVKYMVPHLHQFKRFTARCQDELKATVAAKEKFVAAFQLWITIATIAIVCLFIVILFVTNHTLSRSIRTPLISLMGSTDAIIAGDYDHTISDVSPDELGDLALAFNRMVEELQRRADNLNAANHQILASQQQLKAANQQLLAREQLQVFKQFAEKSATGTGWADINGNIIYANSTLCRMFGEDKPEDIYGKPVALYYDEKTQQKLAEKIFPAVLAEGQWIGELDIHSKNGKVIPTLNHLFVMCDEENNPVYFANIVTDITDRKESEKVTAAYQQLRASQQQLQQANANLEVSIEKADLMAKEAISASHSKSEFLSNMSHEIRTPMNAVIGFSDLLAGEGLTGEQEIYVSTIRESGQHLLKLIDDILDFSKIEAGKLETEIKECDLGEILESINSLMRPSVTAKGLDFEILQTSSLPSRIKTDPTRLRQCLMNLLGNAIKFTKSGHVYVNVSLEQRDDNESYIRFDVEDTGIGIQEDEQVHVFEAFVQAESGTTRKFGGTGLGLAITKQLAELLGGTISLSSEVGRGSVFTITIPTGLDISDQDSLDKYDTVKHLQDTEQTETSQQASGRILVAEDDAANQNLFEVLLKKMGCQFVIVSDGKEAVEKITAENFDLVLMDMQMPVMDGDEATKAIRKAGITTPIIAVTAFAMVGDSKKCLDAGCDDYLSKPIEYKELRAMLQKYLHVKAQA